MRQRRVVPADELEEDDAPRDGKGRERRGEHAAPQPPACVAPGAQESPGLRSHAGTRACAAATRGVRLPASRAKKSTTAGTIAIAAIAMNHVSPASVPSPSEWITPSAQAATVNLCSLRDRCEPVHLRA